MASSRSVVIAALIANGAIAVMKFVGFLLTRSPSMLSETFHSISDTGNQVFLLIGIRYSGKEPSREHPFGYGKAQFFYSFLVSVLLFGIAGWESAKHGYDAIVHGGGHEAGREMIRLLGYEFRPILVNYVVLTGAIVFEGWALIRANAGMRRIISQNDWGSYVEAFRKTSDVTTLTAFTEDTIAVSGAGIALLGVFLTDYTGNHVFDAASALIIGLMLMGFALALAWENKRLLLGESLPEKDERELREMAANWDGVEEVVDFRTVYVGPEKALLTADLVFDADMDTEAIDEAITNLEAAMKEADGEVQRVYIEPEVSG